MVFIPHCVEILTVVVLQHIACFKAVFGPINIDCPASNFRVFNGPDVRDLGVDRLLPHSPERLAFAAKPGESHIVRITRSSQLGISQEGANINLDCLPWLSRFPGGSIRWYSIQLDEFDQILNPNRSPEGGQSNIGRIRVGGESNRWLNISQIKLGGGAEDPDSKIFMCEVCVNRGNPNEVCHTANYTSWVVGAPPVIINGSSTNYLDVVRNREALSMLSLVLECSVDHSVPRPVPQPLLSWYKDGEPVSFAQLGESAQLNESFLTAYPILNLGVFDVPSFQVFPDGRVILATNFNNITLPMLGNLSATTTLEQARELVFDVFCGNWTCLVSNSLGSSSVQYTVGECANIIPPSIEIGWLGEPVLRCEGLELYMYFLTVGVRSGAQLLQENTTLYVNYSESADFTIPERDTIVELSSLDSSKTIVVLLRATGVANKRNRTVDLHLVPVTPFNQSGTVSLESITLTIPDLDRVTISFSQSEYTVSESDSTFLVQLNKSKPLANPLEVVLTALTLEEAYIHGCIPLNTSLEHAAAEVNKDFSGTSYFSSRASFAADEGDTPTNQLNVSFPIIIDDVIAEDRESFVIMIELRPLCETGALFEVQERCSLVHIIDNDGCGSDITLLPWDSYIRWPPTLKGDSVEVRCSTSSVNNVMVTRRCDESGEWSEPDGIQDCENANVNEVFGEVVMLFNQSSLGAEAAALLASRLSSVTQTTTDTGAGQNDENLEVIERVFDTLALSDVNEEVVLEVVSVLDNISDWQSDIVEKRSSNIIMSFEAITANLSQQVNFTKLTSITEDIIFHTERRDAEQLLEMGISVYFNTVQGVLFNTTSDSDTSRVTLPPSLFKSLPALLDQPGLVFTSYSTAVLFPLTQYETTISTRFSMISSSVLGATVVAGQPTAVRDLTEPIVMEFRVNRSMLQNATSVQCVSWNFEAAGGRGNWTSEGCVAVYSESNDTVQCHCNHLTNFAILVEICVRTGGCEETDSVYSFVLELASTIGVCLSIGGLVLAILTQLILIIMKSRSSKEREKQSAVQYKFYLQLSIALLCMYIVFLAGIDRTKHYIGCVIASVLLHYFALASVLWMSAICSFLFWIMVVNPFAKAKFNCCHMIIITLICWAVPVVPVVIPVAIDRDFVIAYSNRLPTELEFCFIKDQIVFFAAFIGPLFVLVLMNAVMFVCITFVQLRYICCTRRQHTRDSKNSSKSSNTCENFIIILKLWCILCLFGLTWLFGALTITRTASFIFSTLFAVFTSLQGFFIFIFLCVLSKDVLRTYKHIICCKSGEVSITSKSDQKSGSHSTKSSSLATKDLYQSYKPAQDDAMKVAFARELSKKVKLYEQERGEEMKTSTFKPS